MKNLKGKRKRTTNEMPGAVNESGNQLGCIRLHENVISSIVRKAACSVEGVVRLAGSTLVDNIAEIVGSKRIHDRSILVGAINGEAVYHFYQTTLSGPYELIDQILPDLLCLLFWNK